MNNLSLKRKKFNHFNYANLNTFLIKNVDFYFFAISPNIHPLCIVLCDVFHISPRKLRCVHQGKIANCRMDIEINNLFASWCNIMFIPQSERTFSVTISSQRLTFNIQDIITLAFNMHTLIYTHIMPTLELSETIFNN